MSPNPMMRGNVPARPFDPDTCEVGIDTGITIREEIASRLMVALIPTEGLTFRQVDQYGPNLAAAAVRLADMLIEACLQSPGEQRLAKLRRGEEMIDLAFPEDRDAIENAYRKAQGEDVR